MPLTNQPNRGRGGAPGDEQVEIIEVTEKHGPLYNAIPCLPLPAAIFLCILNIVVPGLGEYIVVVYLKQCVKCRGLMKKMIFRL